MIYILLVAKDPVMRHLLDFYFRNTKVGCVIQSVDSVTTIDITMTGNQVDLILLDINKETNISSIEDLGRLQSLFPNVKSLVITDLPEVGFIERARKAGIDSFWYKDSDLEELLSIIQKTMNGEHIFPAESKVIPFGDAFSDEITMREFEVLRELIEGETDAVIAEKLHISLRTVKGHIQSVREKTGFRNRTELAVRTRESGLVINEKNKNR